MRPIPTALFSLALSLWVTTASGLTQLFEVSKIEISWMVGALVAVVVGLFVAIRKSIHLGGVIAGIGLGLLLACAGVNNIWQGEAILKDAEGNHTFEVVEDGKEGEFSKRCVAWVADIAHQPLVQITLPKDIAIPRFGETFEAYASFSALTPQNRAYANQKGIAAQARCTSIEVVESGSIVGVITSLRNRVIDAIQAQDNKGSSVLAALVCGWRNDLDQTTSQAFKTAGLAHVLAVSGAHLSVIVTLIGVVLKRMALPRVIQVAIQVLLVVMFVAFAGASPSVLRAASMAIIASCSLLAARRAMPLQGLAICVIGTLTTSPLSALSVSFALSVLATFGIVVFSPLCRNFLACVLRGKCALLTDALSVCLAANVATLPFSAALFSQIPLIGLLSNVVISPLFAPICTLCMLCVIASQIIVPLGPIILSVASHICAIFGSLVTCLSNIPGACVAIELPIVGSLAFSACMVGVLWYCWPKPTAKRVGLVVGAMVMCCVVIVFAMPWLGAITAGNSVVMLNVGQGDSFLLRSQGAALLIDTGNQEAMLKAAIARNHITRLDAVLITHGDDDHMGNLDSLAQYVEIGKVFLAQGVKECSCNNCKQLLSTAYSTVGENGVQTLRKGDQFALGEFDCKVVWPVRFNDEGGNADSICLMVGLDENNDDYPEWSALFVGDAESKVIEPLITSGEIGKINLLKVGHHGSAQSLTKGMIDALKPQVALIGVGEYNRYGHPNEEIIGILEDAEVSVFRSDIEGDVSCKIRGETMMVTTQN